MNKFSQIQTDWIEEEGNLRREFKFKDFNESINFTIKVAKIANKLNHHPSITINYNKVKIETTTHDEGNIITEKDYRLCQEIDKIF